MMVCCSMGGMKCRGIPEGDLDEEPKPRTSELRLSSWEEFLQHVAAFDNSPRKPWDEILVSGTVECDLAARHQSGAALGFDSPWARQRVQGSAAGRIPPRRKHTTLT